MSASGHFHFFSLVRRGIGASINNAPASGENRVGVNVQLSIVDQSGTSYSKQPAPVLVQLYGPGDVIGIDPRHIIRTEPLNSTVNFEPNYLCAIEFDSPDFPWMFTPLGPTGNTSNAASGCPAGDRLQPWVALIALKQGEFERSPDKPNPVAKITVTKTAALQDLSDSWDWAHVQVNGDSSLNDTLTSAPGNVFSRLLCPRRLDPESSYTAFLVPTFDSGRLAGLGQQPSAGADPVALAWPASPPDHVDIPVYYEFSFRTSDEGDFESLVRRLQRLKVLPDGVGKRPMDVSHPGLNLPSAGTPLALEGALRSPAGSSTAWNPQDKAPFQAGLRDRINLTSPVVDDPATPVADDPVVAPPIYGHWAALVARVSPSSTRWVDDLNLDPRTRSAAGMGTQVVQKERSQLIAGAWQQLDGVLEANQLIQQAQLARASLAQMYANKFQPASTDTALNLTAPVHARVMGGTATVRAVVRNSRIPERVLSATYRRATRPRRRLTVSIGKRESLLRQFNDGKVVVVPKPIPPQGMTSIEEVSESREESLERRLVEILTAIEAARRASHGITRRFFLTILLGLATLGVGAAIAGVEIWEELDELFGGRRALRRVKTSSFTPQQVASIPERPSFVITPPGSPPVPGPRSGGGDSPQATNFRGATSGLFQALDGHAVDPSPRRGVSLSSLQQKVIARIDPNRTVSERTSALLSIFRINWQPDDILASPILAAPDFPQPMYIPLRDLSPSYLLPGADSVPAESVSLVVQNHKFIESYMVGLSHEMTRQLIWEEYPTFDQRATYFRQFWDVSGYVPQPGDPSDPKALQEMLKDIPLVQLWPQKLGDNVNRTTAVSDSVVLLVRGELFRRYPNAIVYAIKAKRNSKGERVSDPSDERYYIFRGTLPTDMTFLGFNLSVEDARGGTSSSPEGFFFVFQQPPSEPRFGLEPSAASDQVSSWAELAWTNFATTGPITLSRRVNTTRASTLTFYGSSPWRLASQVFASVLQNFSLPSFLSSGLQPANVGGLAGTDAQNSWGQNSAQTAYILFRQPFRILIHADQLLPN